MSIDEDNVMKGKRKNGHKIDCKCHICENMRAKAARHGYEEDMKKEKEKKIGGSHKKNGHKKDCGCVICNNMKNSSKGRGKLNNVNSEKNKKTNGHKSDCSCPICNNMKKTFKGGIKYDTTTDDELEEQIKEHGEKKRIEGGKLRRKGTRKSNGHKPNCGCPICKNMKKTRKNRKS
jgi:hypothetical protein